MGERHYYNEKGQYTGKSKAPIKGGGASALFLIVLFLIVVQWLAHNYWLALGICSALIVVGVFMRHAFRNFEDITFGHFVIFAVLSGFAYFAIFDLHRDKVGYRTAERFVQSMLPKSSAK